MDPKHIESFAESTENWICRNLSFLVSNLGVRNTLTFEVNEGYFPLFNKSRSQQDLIHDFVNIFEIKDFVYEIEVTKDIRDTYGVPYEINEKPIGVYLYKKTPGTITTILLPST